MYRTEREANITHLNTMVIRVGNDDTIRVGDGNVVWMFELAFLLAAAAKFTDEGAVRLEDLQFARNVFGLLGFIIVIRCTVGKTKPNEIIGSYLNTMIFLITYVDEA